jgi:eukaryotic-like serine/threonine-protein kinase
MMADPLINQEIGNYRILERLEIGGMSIIYKAFDKKRDEEVAFKVLRENFSDEPQIISRFKLEAKLTQELDHPNIVPFYDYGEVNGMLYIVIKLMAAGSLYDRLYSESGITLGKTVHWLGRIAEALDYAHAKKVVHRDLKPGNFLMANDDDVYLSDFGIARMLEGTTLTATGQAIPGTVRYMSPEQIKAERGLDHSSDIYSFGIIAYLMTTGHFPFTGKSVLATMNQHLKEVPPLPSAVNENLPVAVDLPLLCCLEKRATARYKDMASFMDDFKAALAGYEQVVVDVDPRAPNPLGSTSQGPSHEAVVATTQPLRDIQTVIDDFYTSLKSGKTTLARQLLDEIRDSPIVPPSFDMADAVSRLQGFDRGD